MPAEDPLSDNKTRILGIDPGTNVMGFALLDVNGKKSEVVTLGVVKMAKLPTHLDKLAHIFQSVNELITNYSPNVLAIEEPFYGKNPQSMLKLGRAQGVVMTAAIQKQMPVFEYTPRRVKQAVTGVGSASKEQVAAMLSTIYPSLPQQDYLDATDALAIALCHHLQNSVTIASPKRSGWQAFITQHSDRIINN